MSVSKVCHSDDRATQGHFVMGLALSSFIGSKLRSCLADGNVYYIYMSIYDSAFSAVEVHPTYIIQVDEVMQFFLCSILVFLS